MIANISNQKLQLVTSIQILIRQQVDDRQHIQSEAPARHIHPDSDTAAGG